MSTSQSITFEYVKLLLVLYLSPLAVCQRDDIICGARPGFGPGRRVFNGRDATPGAWPWSGRLMRSSGDRQLCSMSLIDSQWAVTSAHCFTPFVTAYGIFGDNDIYTLSPYEQRVEFDKVVIHPEYQFHPNYNNSVDVHDLALLHLTTPVNFTNYVQPVCLSEDTTERETYSSCWYAGWGSDVAYTSPRYLQEIPWMFLPPEQCFNAVLDIELCGIAKEPHETGQGCPGDSGGGVYCSENDERWYLVGVLSYGSGLCGSATNIHTRISNYTDFITNVTMRFEECSLPDLLCENGQTCAFAEEICDGNMDCPGGEDERNCTVIYCSNTTCQNGGECVDGRDGFTCLCSSGWKGKTCTVVDCGDPDILLSPGNPVNLTSPGYPIEYTNNVYCVWEVNAPEGYQIFLEFIDMSLEYTYDFLYINFQSYSGNISENNIPDNYTSQANSVRLVFQSDSNVVDRGFAIRMSAMNATGIDECSWSPCENGANCTDKDYGYICECTDEYVGETCSREVFCGQRYIYLSPNSLMNITSFGYPNFDPPRHVYTCTWIVFAPAGQRIHVVITDLNLLPTGNDMLAIGEKPIVDILSETLHFDDYISDGNVLRIQFLSFFWTSDKNFWLTLQIFDEPDGDECISQPCQNGGLCNDRVNDFACKCRRGFTGKYCQIGRAVCPRNSFACQNGRCISPFFVCDGKNHCGNGLDEMNCECEFRCHNGRCIPQRYVCDKNNNCRDWSDENRPECETP